MLGFSKHLPFLCLHLCISKPIKPQEFLSHPKSAIWGPWQASEKRVPQTASHLRDQRPQNGPHGPHGPWTRKGKDCGDCGNWKIHILFIMYSYHLSDLFVWKKGMIEDKFPQLQTCTCLGIMPQPGSQSSSTDRECRRMDDQQSHMPQSEHAIIWDAMEASHREYPGNHIRHLLAHLPCSMVLCLYGTFQREEQGEDLPKINDACSRKPNTLSQSSICPRSWRQHEESEESHCMWLTLIPCILRRENKNTHIPLGRYIYIYTYTYTTKSKTVTISVSLISTLPQ